MSRGAVVGVTYAQRDDWYEAVLGMTLRDFPGLVDPEPRGDRRMVRPLVTTLARLRMLWALFTDWGPVARAREAGLKELGRLVGHGRLYRARIPVVVTATDLRSGERMVLRTAPSDDAVYASAALAGVLPPLEMGEHLLADGVYSDLAPVDVARALRFPAVIAADGHPRVAAGLTRGRGTAAIRPGRGSPT